MTIENRLFMYNRLIYSFFAIILMAGFGKGQRHELGVQLGMSNLVGDIGKTSYIFQKPVLSNISDYGIPFYGGILYRMNFNPYQTVRLNLGYSHIQFIDASAKEQYRKHRGLSGTNSMIEADLIFEYNFFPVNDEQKSLLSPYIFGGIGGMLANSVRATLENDFYRDPHGSPYDPREKTIPEQLIVNGQKDFRTTESYTSGNRLTMAIPFGVGLKYKFNYNWALFGEFMFRPTFSDTIDYSVIDEKDLRITYNKDILATGSTKSLLQENPYLQEAKSRAAKFLKDREVGNINSKDWVNTMSVGLTYSFGRPPCYCGE